MELLLSLEAVDMEIGRTSKLLRASVFACNVGVLLIVIAQVVCEGFVEYAVVSNLQAILAVCALCAAVMVSRRAGRFWQGFFEALSGICVAMFFNMSCVEISINVFALAALYVICSLVAYKSIYTGFVVVNRMRFEIGSVSFLSVWIVINTGCVIIWNTFCLSCKGWLE